MCPASFVDIAVWADNVESSPPEKAAATADYAHNDQENVRAANKRRIMDDGNGDDTPRPKRSRGLDGGPCIVPQADDRSETATISSHQSGRLSPTKQLQALEDFEEPVLFCNFGDDTLEVEGEGVMHMRKAIRRFADGIGILGYEEVTAAAESLSEEDKTRFAYPWSNDAQARLALGSMPSMASVRHLVSAGWEQDRGAGTDEDDSNSHVHLKLIQLAHGTSKHASALAVHSVKSLLIEPSSLARTVIGMPRRVIDYVIALEADAAISSAYSRLTPLWPATTKSWNYFTRKHRNSPIAINIETKGPNKSWTDGKL